MVDLLSSEEAVIDKAKSLLEQEKSIPVEVRSHFEELLKAYIKLNKGQSRLIRLSDKSQDKLNIANAKLENFSSKLSKYFSPQVYQSLFTGELDVKIETKRKQLTVFFSDLQGFTELTERLEPEVLTKLLTHYLTEMSRISIKWGGTIDKFIGDAIMIFFGDPNSQGENQDAINCVKMAMEMLDKLEELREDWRRNGLALPINARIGIHTGICTVGNFGSEDRLDYTIIGNGVNLASRLESHAKPNSILVSEDTYLHIQDEIFCNKHQKFYEDNDNCPTCKQVLSNKQELIADNNKQVMKWNQALEDVQREIKTLSGRLNKIKSVEQDMRTTEIDIAKFGQSKVELNNINTKLTHKIEELKKQSSEDGEALGKLRQLEEEHKEKENTKLTKVEELDYLQAAKTMLMDSGIKTKVIKQYLPIMNKLINAYLQSMEFYVNFNLDENFTETIKSRYRDAFNYASFSEGEKMRIDLALLFTWRAIAKMKNSTNTNLLILDEIFDSSLDGQGTDDFLKILNTLENENVFIISHKTDMIADRFKNVIKYEKVGNFTKVVE